MSWNERMRRYPLRVKVLITLVGTCAALLGVSMHFSFRYWKTEAVTAAEQQALLAAASARTAVEAGLQSGRQDQARRALRRLTAHAPILAARVYGTDGGVLISHDPAEEGRRVGGTWLPGSRELPADGVGRVDAERGVVRAFVPVSVPPATLLEVEYALGPVRAAMDRGARLGLVLVVSSVFALAAILFMMIEREVVAPVTRMSSMLESRGPASAGRTDELRRLEASVAELVEKEQQVEGLAAEQRRRLDAQAGYAQVGEMAAEMAHEFKRPLASIQSAIGLLAQEYVLEERGQMLIGAVEEQLGHLSETMRDLFTLAKPVGIEFQPVSMKDILDSSVALLAGHPAAAGLELRREQPDADVVVMGDPRRLEQVVLNLMLNAAEAMHGGGTLTLRLTQHEDVAHLVVGDTGVGIPQAEIDRVMLPFYSTKPSGTGLGLPLVARIVAAHQGRIHIESEPGRGTRVSIELPLAHRPVTALPRQELQYG
jgi:signal transduction histidine kinase